LVERKTISVYAELRALGEENARDVDPRLSMQRKRNNR